MALIKLAVFASKNVHQNQKSKLCCQCGKLIHMKCNNILPSEFEFPLGNLVYLPCTIHNNSKIFPFTLESDELLQEINCTNFPSLTDSLPSFEISSKLTNLPNLSDYDVDDNINKKICSQYCSPHEVSSLLSSSKDLSFFHMNIRSLTLHHDELQTLISSLNVNIQVIGLSEIKASFNAPIKTNIELPGYKFHFTPSQSSAGGVGIYVKTDLTANKRDDLSISNVDFESVWIEIENSKSKNILCCCVYRHPSSAITKFNDHLEETLHKVEKENKLVFIMGDFNIDLLIYEKDTPTNEFINMMFSHHLQPSVLHPTRITDTSATLIDNIFVSNASDSNIQSGNILSLISDHLPQFCIINDCEFDYNASSYLSYDYSHFDANKFFADYAELDMSFLTDENANLNAKFNEFLLTLHCLIDKHCPQKS